LLLSLDRHQPDKFTEREMQAMMRAAAGYTLLETVFGPSSKNLIEKFKYLKFSREL